MGDKKMVCVTLHLLPYEVEEIRQLAEQGGISAGEWKRRAIRAALEEEENVHEA